jgi:Protein of unknown function (DUF3095)
MDTADSNLFYSRLPVNTIALPVLLMEEHLFYKVPGNWHIIVTDIKNSTRAGLEGRHQTVNLIATGCIVAVLNLANKSAIEVPFFFGGDGATFIVPPDMLDEALSALRHHSENARNNFNLDLRVGHIPVAEVYSERHQLKISKFKTAAHFEIPILLGDGLTYAEKKIKEAEENRRPPKEGSKELDMSGMQCRWDKIKPPAKNFEVISLLLIARDEEQQALVFKTVINAIDEIYGNIDKRTPISIDKLKLKATVQKIKEEMKTRFGGYRGAYLLKNFFTLLLGKLYFKTKKGKQYLHSLVDNSDTLIIDGRINTVITGTKEQREQLNNALQELEKKGQLLYGLHVSSESVMSCYVKNLDALHIHFVDGADGGYTKAAGMLKQKISLEMITR